MRERPFYVIISGFAPTSDKNEDTSKHQGIVARLAERFLCQAANSPSPETPDWRFDDTKFSRAGRVIKAIFYTCVVGKSIALGLIDVEPLCRR